MTNFAVVEFLDEKSVDVVPEFWLEKRDEVLYCYYPRTNVVKRVQKKELPDKQRWSAYKIKVLSVTGNYGKAIKRAKKAEDTSNLDTSGSESDKENDRPNKRHRRAIDYAESEGDDLQHPLLRKETMAPKNALHRNLLPPTPPTFPRRSLPSLSRTPAASTCSDQMYLSRPPVSDTSANGFQSAELVGESLRILQNQPQDELLPNDSSFQSTLFSEREDAISGLLHDVIDPLVGSPHQPASGRNEHSSCSQYSKHGERSQSFQTSLTMKLDMILENQREILVYLRRQSSAMGGACDEVFDDVLTKPMDSVAEVEELCGKLDETTFNKSFVNYLSAQCGHNCGDTVRRIMAKLGTNKLWSLYSFKGRKGKKAFKGSSLCNVIIKASMRCHKKATELNVEEQVSETLKHAPSKPGGSRYQNSNETS